MRLICHSRWTLWSAVAVGAITCSTRAIAAAPASIVFNRDIRPILSDACFACHGPDAGKRQADLRLDLRDEAVAAGAIVPGKAAESPLIDRILATDPEIVMPPPEAHKTLDARQKDLLSRWIDAGAPYQRHWAYEKPVRPDVPAGESAIDLLIDRALSEAGLTALGEADRRTLIRRLSFDLTGLPPKAAEVEAFLADQSPDAYERVVERLLASPHHGERMAVAWLDVVRFADTIGYHSDNPRNIWPYRDYVIASFNANKPFDRFTREQLAGDLLPDANQETRVGSAFNRLLLSTEEGGAQPRDYEARMLTDRVRAVGAVWLGQTTGCAQCHDHKFDPFTMRDFYSLGAFFADIQEPILGRREEGMVVGTPDEVARLAELAAALAAARKAFDAVVPRLDAAQAQWEADVVAYKVTLPELVEGATPSAADRSLAVQASAAVRKETSKRNGPEQKAIQDYFRSKATTRFRIEIDAVAVAEKARNDHYGPLAKCLVSIHTDSRRAVRILPRGDWMNESGEIVKAALPRFLAGDPPPEGRDLTRLDLAQWVLSPDNPLTARVVMNRLWKQFFGAGLSRVLDDLGGQGEPPSHPELLDWMACEFRESGWDMRHMIRRIVSSRAYRRASVAPAALHAAAPSNRWLARQSAWRLEAELVRDTALAVSGLLSPTIGGPSVRPYQPDGYWENLNFPTRTYVADSGAAQHRRGLYTWWQRSFLHPSLLAFDAPPREECCAERTRSNIPQQALVLLNDPTYVEAARGLATAILREGGSGDEERIAWAWRRVLQRAPRVEEMETILPLVKARRSDYADEPEAAAALVQTGVAARPDELPAIELAAWTHVARVLLNLHETITRP
ncbi:MAG: PSD1 and planctomycete cytochrome C domain-containing protein [Planctomycetaceae bacterium]